MGNIVNLEHDPVWIKSEYLYKTEDTLEPYIPAYLGCAKSLPGRLFEFECLIPEFWGLRDKLPLEAIFWRQPSEEEVIYPSQLLQRWECFSTEIFVIAKTLVQYAPVVVTLEDGTRLTGMYRYTIDSLPENVDTSFVLDPTEHKAFNFVQLDNGQYGLFPNNLCQFAPPSLVEGPPQKPARKPRVADTRYYPSRRSVSDPESYLYD